MGFITRLFQVFDLEISKIARSEPRFMCYVDKLAISEQRDAVVSATSVAALKVLALRVKAVSCSK